MNAFRRATTIILTCLLCATTVYAQTITDEVEQAARVQLDKMAATNGLADPQFDLSVVSARPAPPCAKQVEVEALDVRQPSRMRFVARCPQGRGWRHEFVVRARVSALVAVTAAPVRPNQPLTDADVTLERRDITHIADAVGDASQAIGQSPRRSLRAGEVLRTGQLAAPIIVKRGDQVMMVARHEGIEVSMAGEALDAGARGAVVRVRNAASGQVVRMRVTGTGTVEPVGLSIKPEPNR